jgi:hypothetical protein
MDRFGIQNHSLRNNEQPNQVSHLVESLTGVLDPVDDYKKDYRYYLSKKYL